MRLPLMLLSMALWLLRLQLPPRNGQAQEGGGKACAQYKRLRRAIG